MVHRLGFRVWVLVYRLGCRARGSVDDGIEATALVLLHSCMLRIDAPSPSRRVPVPNSLFVGDVKSADPDGGKALHVIMREKEGRVGVLSRTLLAALVVEGRERV